MKTLDELYVEVLSNDELKKEFIGISDENAILDFAKKNGCDVTLEELNAFFKAKAEERELSDSELEEIAGGKSAGSIFGNIFLSTVTIGLVCDALK